MNEPVKCTAHKSTNGEPCGNWAIKGGTVCRYHGGSAPQVKAAADRRWRERLDAMIDPALDRLEALSESAATEAVKLRATDSILTRAGVMLGDDTPTEHRIVIEWED